MQELSDHGDQAEIMVDLKPYVNTSAVTVPQTFSTERAYLIFRSMGLRHMTVVDESNCVLGMVTRKDLMGYRLDRAVIKAEDSRGSP